MLYCSLCHQWIYSRRYCQVTVSPHLLPGHVTSTGFCHTICGKAAQLQFSLANYLRSITDPRLFREELYLIQAGLELLKDLAELHRRGAEWAELRGPYYIAA